MTTWPGDEHDLTQYFFQSLKTTVTLVNYISKSFIKLTPEYCRQLTQYSHAPGVQIVGSGAKERKPGKEEGDWGVRPGNRAQLSPGTGRVILK